MRPNTFAHLSSVLNPDVQIFHSLPARLAASLRLPRSLIKPHCVSGSGSAALMCLGDAWLLERSRGARTKS